MTPTKHGTDPTAAERRDRFLSRQSVIEMQARASVPRRSSIPAASASCSARSIAWNPPGFRCRESCPSPMTASSSRAGNSRASPP